MRAYAFVFALFLFLTVPLLAQEFDVPGNGGWVDTHLDVARGTRISLRATGLVNVGSRGAFGPHGAQTSFDRVPGYPTDGPAYGLTLRVTSSPTNPIDEVRYDLSYESAYSYCVQQPGHVWLIVNDYNPSDNSGQFLATLSTEPCDAPPLRLLQTIVHVTESGANVSGAEVYLDGRLARTTDANGNVNFPPLPVGTRIMARRRVLETPSHRERHAAGSTQNWRSRVYLTSMVVNDDGSVSVNTITDPDAVQEVRLSPANPLIGFHLTGSAEWDASPAQLQGIVGMVRGASQFLYNATDGQFFIEQFDLVDNAADWDHADYRIFANWTLRANVGRVGSFFGNCFACGNDYMNMSRLNGGYVYAHEFGHYGLDLFDEYQDDTSLACTGNVGMPASPFSWTTDNWRPQASCMMWNDAPKLCSSRNDNPHVSNTRQGRNSCWSHLISRYADTAAPPRWTLRNPRDRTRIPGTLPTLPEAWQVRVDARSSIRGGGLCMPFTLSVVRRGTTTPVSRVDVYNRTSYGQVIFLGMSRWDDENTAVDETGDIEVVSGHPGDRIDAGGNAYVVPPCSLDVAASRPTPPLIASLEPFVAGMLFQTKQFSKLGGTLEAAPASSMVSLLPEGDQSALLIRFDEPVVGPPAVALTEVGSAKAQPIAVSLDEKTGAWRGTLSNAAASLIGDLTIDVKLQSGRTISNLQRIRFLRASGEERDMEVFSDDGQLSMTLPRGALKAGAGIGLTRSAVQASGAENIISGPFTIAASQPLFSSAVLRFQIPSLPVPMKQSEGSAFNGSDHFDPSSFSIVRLNDGQWQRLETVAHHDVSVYTTHVSELGVFALVARPRGANAPKQVKESPQIELPQKPGPEKGATELPVKAGKESAPGEWTEKLDVTPPGDLLVSAALIAAPEVYEGSCPGLITFKGSITVRSAMTVRYTFLRSDGATGPTITLTFEEPGSQAVETTWSLGGESLPSFAGWQAIQVLEPVDVQSPRAEFKLLCVE